MRLDQHLAFIRTLPCVVRGVYGAVEAAHIRYADPRYGKRETGKSEKPSDFFAVPLDAAEHRQQHGMNERRFWDARRIDPCRVALALWAFSGDEETALVILRNARNGVGFW